MLGEKMDPADSTNQPEKPEFEVGETFEATCSLSPCTKDSEVKSGDKVYCFDCFFIQKETTTGGII